MSLTRNFIGPFYFLVPPPSSQKIWPKLVKQNIQNYFINKIFHSIFLLESSTDGLFGMEIVAVPEIRSFTKEARQFTFNENKTRNVKDFRYRPQWTYIKAQQRWAPFLTTAFTVLYGTIYEQNSMCWKKQVLRLRRQSSHTMGGPIKDLIKAGHESTIRCQTKILSWHKNNPCRTGSASTENNNWNRSTSCSLVEALGRPKEKTDTQRLRTFL